MKDRELLGSFSKLNLFKVVADGWSSKFSPANITIMTRLVCTLESSLGIKSLTPFLIGNLHSIDFWQLERDGYPERYFNSTGILFADTGQVYNRTSIEQFKEDYLIARLAGLRQ